MKKDFDDKNWRRCLPKPVFDGFPEYNELYYKTWEIARAHVKHIKGMPQNPYMDEGFCDTRIWIWDTCFMSLFCKYAQEVFPSVESFNNFYEVLYGDKLLPKVMSADGVLENILIHHPDNPPLFAWAEYENALISGDKEHVKTLLYKKQFLQKHYEWIESLKSPERIKGVWSQTYIIAGKNGYKWAGISSGMDNTPRGRTGAKADKERPNNPDMLWVDAICQQALSAKCISELFSLTGDKENAKIWYDKFLTKKETVNTLYWDKDSGFYYDIDCKDHGFYKVPTIASFWALTAVIATKEQAKKMAEYVTDPEYFGGETPLLSLARKDGDFSATGKYWRGSLWLPTAYAALKGLVKYGYFDVARIAANKILRKISDTYKEYEPHTIWECYSPADNKPATQADGKTLVRPDFCGWSALGPISIYIEFVLGFYEINAFTKTIKWHKPEFKGKTGVKNLRFGDIITDIIVENGVLKVKSNAPYTLILNGKTYSVSVGKNIFDML